PSLLRRPRLRDDRRLARDQPGDGRRDAERRTRDVATGGASMSDIDIGVQAALDRLVPVPARVGDWEDVRRRAARRPRWPLLLAAALALLLAAAALAKALGGFDAWLSGSPGKPAPPAERRRFAAGERHSWAKFPPGTRLRELLR